MTKKQVLNDFLSVCKPFSDYWSMQECWTFYVDGLVRDGFLTQKQTSTWTNPCTPETFKKFNKKFKGII